MNRPIYNKFVNVVSEQNITSGDIKAMHQNAKCGKKCKHCEGPSICDAPKGHTEYGNFPCLCQGSECNSTQKNVHMLTNGSGHEYSVDCYCFWCTQLYKDQVCE